MDKNITTLIKKLVSNGQNDLVRLLIGCRSGIEETDQYGSYLNKFLSNFIIYAPNKNYQKLQQLPENDRQKILDSILKNFPSSEDLEIGNVSFKLLPNEKKLEQNKNLASSWLSRAKNKLDEGRESLDRFNYSEAISSFQECIELSLKAVTLFLLDKYSKDHKSDEKEFVEVLDNVPETLKNLEFHKLYLYSRFWGNFYTVSKYGLETFGVGAQELFEKEEGELAKKHADKCYSAVMQLKDYSENPW